MSTLKVVSKKIEPPPALEIQGLKAVSINTFCPIGRILDSNDELGNTAGLSFDGSMEPVTGEIDVTWTLEGDYNDSPSAENTFRWSFDVSKLEDYEIAVG